jgi:hypothetical protein
MVEEQAYGDLFAGIRLAAGWNGKSSESHRHLTSEGQRLTRRGQQGEGWSYFQEPVDDSARFGKMLAIVQHK